MELKKLVLLVAILTMLSCRENNDRSDYVEYVPQIFNDDNLAKAPKMMTEKHRGNVILVLKYYGEKWKLENGKLLVSKKIEPEVLWNYTSKANDSIWLVSHKTK